MPDLVNMGQIYDCLSTEAKRIIRARCKHNSSSMTEVINEAVLALSARSDSRPSIDANSGKRVVDSRGRIWEWVHFSHIDEDYLKSSLGSCPDADAEHANTGASEIWQPIVQGMIRLLKPERTN